MRLRVLIADDESMALKRLRRLLSAMPDIEIVAECTDGTEVLELLRGGLAVDVAVLDIRMPRLSGLDARGLMLDDAPFVIFATAHADHALEAFDVGATDYVLKPISAERLHRALQRAKKALRSEAEPRDAGDTLEDKLAVSTSKGVVLLNVAEISHAVLESKLVTVHTQTGDYITDLNLRELEARLEPKRFRRVHRQAIVNLDHIALLEPEESGGYVARLKNGALVRISRKSARALRRDLGLRGTDP